MSPAIRPQCELFSGRRTKNKFCSKQRMSASFLLYDLLQNDDWLDIFLLKTAAGQSNVFPKARKLHSRISSFTNNPRRDFHTTDVNTTAKSNPALSLRGDKAFAGRVDYDHAGFERYLNYFLVPSAKCFVPQQRKNDHSRRHHRKKPARHHSGKPWNIPGLCVRSIGSIDGIHPPPSYLFFANYIYHRLANRSAGPESGAMQLQRCSCRVRPAWAHRGTNILFHTTATALHRCLCDRRRNFSKSTARSASAWPHSRFQHNERLASTFIRENDSTASAFIKIKGRASLLSDTAPWKACLRAERGRQPQSGMAFPLAADYDLDGNLYIFKQISRRATRVL